MLIGVISLAVYKGALGVLGCKFSRSFGLQLVFSGHPAVLAVFYFRKQISSPFNKLLEFLHVQILMIIWIAGCLSMVQFVRIRIHCQFLVCDGNLSSC